MVHRRPFGAESQGTPWGWELPRPGSPPSCIPLLPTPGVWGPNNTTPPPPRPRSKNPHYVLVKAVAFSDLQIEPFLPSKPA